MTDVPVKSVKSVAKKAVKTPSKSDETLIQDAKERIMRLQKKKNGGKPASTRNVKSFKQPRNAASRGVVYLGHLPHGFYEEELRGFFSQFGKVARVKVSRSPKTGRSKGYAFVEFAYDDVAKIVAQTMNNYLMFERLIKAQYIPPEKVHAKMFPKYWITPESVLGRKKNLKSKQNGPITQENKDKHRKRLTTKLNRAVNVLKEMGIDYFPQIYDPEMKKTAIHETPVAETTVQAAVSEEVDEEEADEIPQLVAVPTPEPVAKTPENASKKRRQSMKKTPAKSATPTTKTPSSTPKKRITRAAAAAIAAATGTPKASPSVGLKKDTTNVSVGKKRIV